MATDTGSKIDGFAEKLTTLFPVWVRRFLTMLLVSCEWPEPDWSIRSISVAGSARFRPRHQPASSI